MSVIVPIYNSEKYLSKCIESVLVQDFRDWELILVDDGSKDTSAQICESYAAADDRIRVFIVVILVCLQLVIMASVRQ